MKPEPRGFRYALQPLRSKTDWDLQDLQQTLVFPTRDAYVRIRVHTSIRQPLANSPPPQVIDILHQESICENWNAVLKNRRIEKRIFGHVDLCRFRPPFTPHALDHDN